MLRFLFLLFLLLPTQVMAGINYQLDIQLQPDKQSLLGTAVLTPDPSMVRQMVFWLAESCEIIAVHQSGREIPYRFAAGRLRIELQKQEPISISYRGRFNDPVSSTPIHNEDPSYGVSAVVSAAGTFLSSGANWYPRLESENVRYQLEVTAPKGVEAVTSGQRLERRLDQDQSVSRWRIDYPIYGLTLSAGPYQVFEDNQGSVPIYAYFYADSAMLAPVYLSEARNYLNLYEELFGPYPYHKFAIVENFFPTGYGFPSWTLLGSSVIRLPFIIKTSLGHEMAHSWWGTGVRVDYSQGNWSEGLTTYVADYLYKERESALEAQEYRLKILRDYAGLVDDENAFPVSSFLSRNDKASQVIGYGKAAMLFHMLRNRVGDEVFWSVLKNIAQQQLFQRIGWDTFAAEYSAASGSDLTAFFQQWLLRDKGPYLSLQRVSSVKTADGYQVRGIISQTAPYYDLDLRLQLITESGERWTQLRFDAGSSEFVLDAETAPLRLTVDPAADLFRILAAEETPPTTNAVRGSSELLVVRGEEFVPSGAAIKTLLGALRKADLTIKELADMAPTELAEHDLMIFGTADGLSPSVLSSGKLQLPESEQLLVDKSAFIVMPNPLNGKRIAAWFLSANAPVDAVVARKIPHYGKYSYLLFEGDENRQKGTFPPAESPLRVDFAQP